MVISVRGLFHSTASWSRVNREVCMALQGLGEEVFAGPDRRYGFDPCFELPRAFDDIPSSMPRPDVTIGFDHPRYYRTWSTPIRIGILTCEFTRIPQDWIGEINRHLDFIILPSTFCKEVFESEGVPADRIRLLPFGIDGTVFHPAIHPLKKLKPLRRDSSNPASSTRNAHRFLNVSSTDLRKGQDILIKAFLEEFRADEGVELIIKTGPYPAAEGLRRNRPPWRGPDPEECIESLKVQKGGPMDPATISVVRRCLGDHELADLYRSADAFVIPSRSEGFGLSHLEAMACGAPVIATGWGGHRDFCLPDETYLLDYGLRPSGWMQYEEEIPGSMLAEPDIMDLRKNLRWVADHPALAGERAEKASRRIAGMTWKRFAGSLVDLLREM